MVNREVSLDGFNQKLKKIDELVNLGSGEPRGRATTTMQLEEPSFADPSPEAAAAAA